MPEESRFQILYRLFFRSDSNSAIVTASTPGAPLFALTLSHASQTVAGDLLADVTVAAYLVPQVMAYATIAGLPPVTGLWAAVPALIAYVLFGSSRSLSMGPEATTALMTLVAIKPLAAGDPARYAELASTLALLTGVMAVVAWLLRLGFVADLLSRPVLVGYMAGVALIMIADQLQHVTGVPVTGQVFFAQVGSFARGLGHVQPTVLAVSLSVLGFLLLLRWRWPRLPGPLLAVLLATVAVAAFRPGGVGVVGPVPARLPTVQLPALHPQSLRELLLPAFTVLIVGFSDDVVTARSCARRGEEIVANRELPALGVANAGSALVHGSPVSSSGTRTAITVTVGNKTKAYSLAMAAAVLVVLLFAHSLLSRIPTAALGGIVIFAAIQLIDVPAFRRLLAFRRTELSIAVATFLGVLAFDILYGVLIAIGLSVADLLVRVAPPAQRGPGVRTRPGGHARRGRLPRRADHSRPGGIPLRRAAVLRQRRGLPAARPGRRGPAARPPALVRAQRRGQHRSGLHRARGHGRGPRGDHRPGRRVRPGPRQAGPAGPRRGSRRSPALSRPTRPPPTYSRGCSGSRCD